MRPEFLKTLRVRSDAICQRWEGLLRVGALNSRLAAGDETTRAVPASLDHIFKLLERRPRASVFVDTAGAVLPACPCGRNPFPASFTAAEHAIVETIGRVQSELPLAARRSTDLAEAVVATRAIGQAEVDGFCASCPHRTIDPACRHRAAATS